MTLFEELLRRADAWLDQIDRERDTVARILVLDGFTPAVMASLDGLAGERRKHLALLATLDELRRANHPALLLTTRPMRKAVV